MIERVNRLGKDQQELLILTDRKGRLIGKAEPTGVDGEEQPGQDEDLEDYVGLDDEEAEDEEYLAKEIEIADQVQSEVADGDQTGAAITRYGWDPILMPSSVISRVNRLGKDQT